MKSLASVQQVRIDLEAIHDRMVRFSGGRYRAVLEVGGVPFGLKSDLEQEAIVASYAGFLNSLSFPIQMLVRVRPINIDAYLGRIEQRARHELSDRLARLALDHVAYVRQRARAQAMLDHHFYVVVPGQDEHGGWLRWPFRRRPAPQLRAEAARKLLSFRCDETARGLARCGLTARRLDDVDLAQLQYTCWCPERADVQRFRSDLAGYLAPVVRASRAVRAAANMGPIATQEGVA